MAYRTEEEKGLSNSFLLGSANQGCGDNQSKQQFLFQRLCTEGDHEHASVDLANILEPITYPQKKNLLAPLSDQNLKTTKSNKQKK